MLVHPDLPNLHELIEYVIGSYLLYRGGRFGGERVKRWKQNRQHESNPTAATQTQPSNQQIFLMKAIKEDCHEQKKMLGGISEKQAVIVSLLEGIRDGIRELLRK